MTPAGRGPSGTRAAALAAEQRGVVTRAQLRDLGWSAAAIDRQLASGRLGLLWPATYAFGHSVLTSDGWLMAAVLACGPGAHLGGRAAASVRGLLPAWSRIEVITPRKRGIELAGIHARRVVLRPEERDVVRGMPVTSLARTALDVAAREGDQRAADLLDRALLAGQYDHAEVQQLLHTRRGSRGIRPLRVAVAGLGSEGVVFRSRPERVARDLLRGAGFPEPRVNAWFPTRAGHGYELDLWLPEVRIDVEVDGPHHRRPHQRRKDALRDADLASFGVLVVRIPDAVVTGDPGRFVRECRSALAQRGWTGTRGGRAG